MSPTLYPPNPHTAQNAICPTAIDTIANIFPAISAYGLTDVSNISISFDDFSATTIFVTFCPYSIIILYKIIETTIGTIIFAKNTLRDCSPSSTDVACVRNGAAKYNISFSGTSATIAPYTSAQATTYSRYSSAISFLSASSLGTNVLNVII